MKVIKRLAVLILFPFFLFLLSSSLYSATSFESETVYKQYVAATTNFSNDYNLFNRAKSKYVTYRSLASETEAIEATKKMLNSKFDLIINYLSFMRLKMGEETGVINYKENLTYLQLDNEKVAILDLKNKVNGLPTLAELNDLDITLGEEYRTIKRLAFRALGLISQKRFFNLINQSIEQTNSLDGKISLVKPLTDFDTSPLTRKVGLVKQDLEELSRKTETDSQTFFSRIDVEEDSIKFFNELNFALGVSRNQLIDIFERLEDVIFSLRRIK